MSLAARVKWERGTETDAATRGDSKVCLKERLDI